MLLDDPNLLSNKEIRKQLTSLGYSTELTDSIIEQFWFHDAYQSFIQIPQHFELLLRYLEEKKPTKFMRFNFYYYIIEVKTEGKKQIKDTLKKLGIVFEQMQTNQMQLPIFTVILKEIEGPGEFTQKYLVNKGFIKETTQDGIQIIGWMHHSMSEFLASLHILDQDEEPTPLIEKLLIEENAGIKLLKPSWTGTLRFLIEQSADIFAAWTVDFLSKNPDSLIDHNTETLVYATQDTINTKLKQTLFNLVYGYYQEKKSWIPVWAYHNLYKFIDERIYQDLKNNAKTGDDIHKGNIAATIDGMLRNNHFLLTSKERNDWKAILISYAKEKNDRGVLSRHALAALENYKGETDIISQVKENNTTTDSLVKDAFISMCRAVDANSSEAIAYFVGSIADGSSMIYARHALYDIDNQEGILIFLQKIVSNPDFIHSFIDDETIFNKEDKQADAVLIKNINKNKTPEIVNLLKELVINSYTGEKNDDAGHSYFLRQCALIIQEDQPEYLDNLIEKIKALTENERQILFINDIENVISALIKPDELTEKDKIFSDMQQGFIIPQAIRLARKSGNPLGVEVYNMGLELGIIKDPATLQQVDYQVEQEKKIYKQFLSYLKGEKEGTYYPQVFRFFIENQEVIKKMWSKTEENLLLKIAIEYNLDKYDADKIRVRYKDATKRGEYTITSFASYFAEVFQVISIFKSGLLTTTKNREKIIRFIPFVGITEAEVLFEILGQVTDDELKPVNDIMLDLKNDARYFSSQTYTYLSITYPKLKTPKEVLLSFIDDPLMQDHDRVYALENLEKYLSPSDKDSEVILLKLWEPDKRNAISDLANSLLISVYHSQKAIDWRFERIKLSAAPFKQSDGFHSVGDYEAELNFRAFAKPLTRLGDEKYLGLFIDLLEYSLTFVEKSEYREYMNYLWRVVIEYIARDNFLLSIGAVTTIKNWAERHLSTPEVNWLLKQITELTSQNTFIVQAIEQKPALNFAKGEAFEWTYEKYREVMKTFNVEQDLLIFLSHASAGASAAAFENSFVVKLKDKLKSWGALIFFDVEFNNPTISAKLRIHARKSRFMVTICSKRFVVRACDENPNEIQMELDHFKGREKTTGMPFIYPVLYKIPREDWDIVGVPDLQGNRESTSAKNDIDAEVERVAKEIIEWIRKIDPDSVQNIKII